MFSNSPESAPIRPRTAKSAAQIGGYGGLAVAAWLVAAVSTGYGLGVASAETGAPSAESSTDSAASATSAAGTATSSNEPTGAESTSTATGSTPTSTTTTTGATGTSGATSSTTQVGTGVTVSSSGGAHSSTTEPEAPTAPTTSAATAPVEGASGVEAPPTSSAPAAPIATTEPTAPTTPPVTPAPEPEAEQTTSLPAEAESNSDHAAVVNAAATTPGATSPTPATSVAVVDAAATVTQPSATATESSAVPAASTSTATVAASSALTTPAATAAATPTPQVAFSGPLGFLNGIVTNLLNPFLAPAPNTPEPLTPVVWAVLAWVRRNVFNQAPTINYNPTTTVQTGQTVTGNLGASDSEGDKLTYTVTQGPQHGTLTIDQATGNFTYTPNDINYTAAQLDTFTVSVTDGKFNVLSLFSPHGEQASFGLTVLNPTVQRVIVNLPSGYVNPDTPRFAPDGKSLYFAVTPPGGTRTEIHQVNVDGTGLRCVTCGLSPNITGGLGRVVPAPDGRLMIQVATSPNSYVVYEPTTNQLIPVITPPSAARALDPQREMRISPDGKYVVFSQVQLGQTGNFTAVPVVGKLVRSTNAVTGAAEYHIDDARVIFPVGEAKQWTPDGRGVIVTGGQYEMGNVDNVLVDLATGKVTRLTANLDYEEDIDMSPNLGWIAVGSTRTYDALTPMTRIVRPPFLPAQIQGAVYEFYRGTGSSTNVSNQEWLVAIEDELKGENGIPLFVDDDPSTPEDEGDDYNARSMASWNADGTAVAFWEAQAAPLGSPDPGVSRLVVANLQYTTSVGTVQGDLVTPDPTWAPKLSESVPTTLALPPVGTHAGAGGGTATITEVPDPTNAAATLRTVTYNNYVNVDGLILNGSESTSTTASQNTIRYHADITVSGAQTGYLRGDVTINKLDANDHPDDRGDEHPGEPRFDDQVEPRRRLAGAPGSEQARRNSDQCVVGSRGGAS